MYLSYQHIHISYYTIAHSLTAGTHDAHEAATEYKRRVVNTKVSEYQKRYRGIGAYIHGSVQNKLSQQQQQNSSEDIQNDGVLTATQVG